ncbi:hypothetical protein FE394_17305 [Xenorhabdus sp. Reich]|uniref:Uncharacterized protein n=1 Tax=Xenorhabdus littoralis TaxID=2582835 RepID=A0ABU4SQG1_9GAMM|nr:hypothetical protein [Xenorhabdus sp. Reich]MDX8000899.1 hypothetical protein [Xenorhabdus sp. Reich]
MFITPDNFHRRTVGCCLTTSASKSAQMYRNLALPCRLQEFCFRHSEEVILAGDKITDSHIQDGSVCIWRGQCQCHDI